MAQRYELARLTKNERRNLRKQLRNRGKYALCDFQLINGSKCGQGKLIVRAYRDDEDKRGRLMSLPQCRAHISDAWLERLGIQRFGGPTSTSGRNPGRPSVNPQKVMRELVEGQIIDFLRPYMEALTAKKEVVVGHGRSARVVQVPDHRARMQAAEQLFDRVYGKPKQTTELAGGVKVEPVEVPTGPERELQVAEILAAAGALKESETKTKTKKAAGKAVLMADAKARSN